jgi:hypothetical protein
MGSASHCWWGGFGAAVCEIGPRHLLPEGAE